MWKNIKSSKNSKTTISAENGQVTIVAGTGVTDKNILEFWEFVDEICDDLADKTFRGTFSFSPDKISVTLVSSKDKKVWEKSI